MGKKRLKVLLTQFPSIGAIKEAGVDAIARIPGFTRNVAEEIVRAIGEKDERRKGSERGASGGRSQDAMEYPEITPKGLLPGA